MGNQGIRYRIGIALLTFLILSYCLFIYFQDRSGQPGQLLYKLDTLTLNIDSHYVKRNTSTKFSKHYGYNHEANSKSLSIDSTLKNSGNWVKSGAEIKPNRTPTLVISLENADSAALEKMPGIGPVLSARIIKYRDKLGGFYEVDQLREVYGLSDSVFSKIAPLLRLNGNNIKKIDINNPKDIAMLQRYFDGVQHRCIPDLVLGTYDCLQTVSYGYGLSGPTKNQDRTTQNLRLTHGLALNCPGFNGLTPRAPWETLIRMQIQISQAQTK
ncbi:MAG: helix-hairpin-helix domain-containing protein [Chitinophagaceae bacterium]|nr:helix-hairpin-helix domain-containing protein [Chitinophagaceae bacterium]